MGPVILTAIAAVLTLAQTTVLSDARILGVQPDLALIVVSFSAHMHGVQRGQLSGFATGILEDVVGAAPLGFNGLARLCHGAAVGLSRGAFKAEGFAAPMILVLLASLVKQTVTLLVALLASMRFVTVSVFSWETLVEIGYNLALAPFVFLVLRRVSGPQRRHNSPGSLR